LNFFSLKNIDSMNKRRERSVVLSAEFNGKGKEKRKQEETKRSTKEFVGGDEKGVTELRNSKATTSWVTTSWVTV